MISYELAWVVVTVALNVGFYIGTAAERTRF